MSDLLWLGFACTCFLAGYGMLLGLEALFPRGEARKP